MKGKILALIAGLLLVFGMILVSCNPDPGEEEDKVDSNGKLTSYGEDLVASAAVAGTIKQIEAALTGGGDDEPEEPEHGIDDDDD